MRVRVLLAVPLLAVCGVAPAGRAAPPPEVRVQASMFLFCDPAERFCDPVAKAPHAVTVKVGTVVTWFYNDLQCDVILPCPGHNVQFKGGKPGPVVKGSALPVAPDPAVILTRKFTKVGTYSYVCTPHADQGMVGTVTVTKK